MRLFQKKTQKQDAFRQLIHRLSAMPESDLIKVSQLLDLVFESENKSVTASKDMILQSEITMEPLLDDTITEAKKTLHTEQLEKRIEQFKQAKKPKNG
ncbi:hypothetical protein [Streptococcus merionis]|uniref:hypothetical protein n=1 Tax=Streptococcus merionis TaxID=400065 RepID=UPI0035146993